MGLNKNYSVIIDGKAFYNRPIDSDLNTDGEMRKLTIRQDENYTTGCILDYDYTKNHQSL